MRALHLVRFLISINFVFAFTLVSHGAASETRWKEYQGQNAQFAGTLDAVTPGSEIRVVITKAGTGELRLFYLNAVEMNLVTGTGQVRIGPYPRPYKVWQADPRFTDQKRLRTSNRDTTKLTDGQVVTHKLEAASDAVGEEVLQPFAVALWPVRFGEYFVARAKLTTFESLGDGVYHLRYDGGWDLLVAIQRP